MIIRTIDRNAQDHHRAERLRLERGAKRRVRRVGVGPVDLGQGGSPARPEGERDDAPAHPSRDGFEYYWHVRIPRERNGASGEALA